MAVTVRFYAIPGDTAWMGYRVLSSIQSKNSLLPPSIGNAAMQGHSYEWSSLIRAVSSADRASIVFSITTVSSSRQSFPFQ
jgi:hypothetical protein